jgi:phosphoglucosamine mutase
MNFQPDATQVVRSDQLSPWQHDRKLFGTDGIRGRANVYPMVAETALRLAMASALEFTSGAHRHIVVLGKDTRLSGYMLEPALTAGLISMGMDVALTGPLPTPALAMLTRSMRAAFGIMITASHNPYEDNGIKLFGPDGSKLSDEVEARIEATMEAAPVLRAGPAQIGRTKRVTDVTGRYIEFVKNTVARSSRLHGLRVVIDCANGAAYRIAPTVLHELGATVTQIGVTPNGTNINQNCGATAPAALCAAVRHHGADVGIALDGDADRLVMCDAQGETVDGDQILALIASDMIVEGRLTGDGVVATVMSNLGLERYLGRHGLRLFRTSVGDRHVLAEMNYRRCNLGGEQSGHIILNDHSTTGDGLIAALQVLDILSRRGRPFSEIATLIDKLPQKLQSVDFRGTRPLEVPRVRQAIREGEERLGSSGRLLVRKSGTEQLVRVMAEGADRSLVDSIVRNICEAVSQADALA